MITESNIKYLNNCIDKYDISIDGVDEESCSRIRGKGVFKKVIESIELIKKYGDKEIYLSMMFDDFNENLRGEFLQLCKRLGVHPLMRAFERMGAAPQNWKDFEKNEEEHHENSKLGLQYRYQQGKVQVNHKRFMGYTKDEDGNLTIVPEEAEIIKRIYREYLEGQSLVGIGRALEKDGILTAAGKPRWRPESVKKILQNEKYIGDALLQKTVTVDFLTKKRVKNEGHVPQYYVENSHEAIIPKELFLQAQEEIHRRSNIYTGEGKNKRIYSSKYALSAITFCGDCGDIYRRVYWNIHGRKEFVWRCVTRIEQGPEVCKNRTVKEDELYGAVMTAINKLLAGGNNMIKTLEENIHAVIGETTEYQISEINNSLEEKQKELIKLANKGQDYDHLADEIDELRDKRQILLVEDASLSGENERINELIEFIRKNKFRTLEYDDKLVRKIIQSVTVYEGHFVIAFKSGIEMEI